MAPESSLSEATRAALNNSQVIDLTTTGRRTGQLRRIEIFLHNDHAQLFITGMPRADRTRDWIYNIEADPNVVIHVKPQRRYSREAVGRRGPARDSASRH